MRSKTDADTDTNKHTHTYIITHNIYIYIYISYKLRHCPKYWRQCETESCGSTIKLESAVAGVLELNCPIPKGLPVETFRISV